MASRATAALTVLAIAIALIPNECHGFFDLLGTNRKNNSVPVSPTNATALGNATNVGNATDIKPTIEVTVYPPEPARDVPREPKRRGGPRRGLNIQPAASAPSAPDAEATPVEQPAPAQTAEPKAPDAQVVLKSGQEGQPPAQTVLSLPITKENMNFVASIDVSGQPPIVANDYQVNTVREGETESDDDPTSLYPGYYPLQGSSSQPNEHNPFVADPSNPGVMYGPYPSELGYKPFGFLPQYRNPPNYGYGNVMEMGPHPWWHPYIRRRRMWYDYPQPMVPQHPWQPQGVQYMPLTHLWSRQRVARESLPLEMDMFGMPEGLNEIPQSYSPYPYYQNYPYYNPYSWPYHYPYTPTYPYQYSPYNYGYPWHTPLMYSPMMGNGEEDTSEETDEEYYSDEPKNNKSEKPVEDEYSSKPHIRHQNHRQAEKPSWEMPQVQQPWPRPHHYPAGRAPDYRQPIFFPPHHFAQPPVGAQPYPGAPPSADAHGPFVSKPPTDAKRAAKYALPPTLQRPIDRPVPLTPPPPPEAPPAPPGGEVSYHRIS